MKKFLSVALILFTVALISCSNKNESNTADKNREIASVLLKDSLWVADSENMPYLNDAIVRKDVDYLQQLMREGKVFLVDKDTKVLRFGVSSEKDSVLILFKEGRYTNKKGCTHASNVIEKEEYSTYLKKQSEKIHMLIKDNLSNTENYSNIISAGNLEEIKRLSDVCFENRNNLGLQMEKCDSNIRQCMYEAAEINFERYNALFYFLEYSKARNSVAQKHYKEQIAKTIEKAEQLRQDFRAKYGY